MDIRYQGRLPFGRSAREKAGEMIIAFISIENKKIWVNGGYRTCDGIEIVTLDQNIVIALDNNTQCCESFGMLGVDEEELKYYLGEKLLSIEIVNEKMETTILPKVTDEGDSVNAVFINFKTTLGTFQITVYNAHNGYYGHGVVILSKPVVYTSEL